MHYVAKIFWVFIFCCVSSGALSKNDSDNLPVVKQSVSGICHDTSSGSYKRTKRFKSFNSITECLNSGGRLPKSATQKVDKAIESAIASGTQFVLLYNRSDWQHWSDDDSDCQNTRHELLISTSREPVSFKTEARCAVSSGAWFDPYSGGMFLASAELDLDHIVPLKFAHGHGGDKWSRARKKEFANDDNNLLLVENTLNRQKGAKGIDEWLPPNHSYRCEYIQRFILVMTKYELYFIASEQRIVNKLSKACQKE